GPGATWGLSALELTGECSRSGAWRVNHADVCGNPARGQLNLAGALRDTLLFIVDPTNWPRSVRGLLLSGASSDFVILWTEQCASTAGTQEDTGRSDVRHETPRVYHAYRWRGGGMAALGACTAARADAVDRSSWSATREYRHQRWRGRRLSGHAR